MLRKIILIGIILILLTSISQVTGINQEISKTKYLGNTYIDKNITDLIKLANESILRYYLEKFVSFGPKDSGSENCKNAAEWIKQEFEHLGLYTYFDDWKYIRARDRNVISIKNGTDPTSDAVILICAHYDTIGDSPGANDDGSGIAAMLTIANITRNYSFNHTIRFAAVSGEEIGTYGSHFDAKKAYKNDENIYAVLNIDSIGYAETADDGKLLQIFARESSQWITDFAQEISDKYNLDLKLLKSANYPADHEPYNDYGFHGIQFVQPNPEEAHWFHTPEDTIDKINFTYFVKVAKLSLATICEIADKPIDLQIRIITPYEGCIYFHKWPILKLPGFNLCFSRLRGLTYIWGKTVLKIEVNTSEEINAVYFEVDGYVRHVRKEQPYEFTIGKGSYRVFPLLGYHTITVYVVTNTGKIANDEMDVFICRYLR